MQFAKVLGILLITLTAFAAAEDTKECRQEKFRPQIHYTIPVDWANDPNGLVYLDGEYHFHYQYTPGSPYSGAKSWAHVVSTDLMHWDPLPVALSPDESGDIWSGSAVVDFDNTTGFQQDPDILPIVAVFTHNGPSQSQSIAYSLDKARTYTKYAGNPVVPNPGERDFRDPKVIRFGDKWVMVLAVANRVQFYGSTDLKQWEYMSEFGADQGSHGGVWECPDLLKMDYKGFTYWVLLVSTSNGSPNIGTFTQYFVGSFNGREFHSDQKEVRYLDTLDNYASVAFFNEPKGRHIIIGWMTNGAYAVDIPTGDFRGEFTLPRQLTLASAGGSLHLKSSMVEEFNVLRDSGKLFDLPLMKSIQPNEIWKVSEELGFKSGYMEVDLAFNIADIKGLSAIAICFLNRLGQELCVGYDHERPAGREIFFNRERTGDLGIVNGNFIGRATAGRIEAENIITFQIILDWSALELFVDGGLTAMTGMFFPDEPLDTLEIRHHASVDESRVTLINGKVQGLRSVYDC